MKIKIKDLGRIKTFMTGTSTRLNISHDLTVRKNKQNQESSFPEM